ncbi:MAG: CapA family protein [Defluviitaleaceae bacterium]|nr:CapA family protein [Defluviitaleaceae bacterium]
MDVDEAMARQSEARKRRKVMLLRLISLIPLSGIVLGMVLLGGGEVPNEQDESVIVYLTDDLDRDDPPATSDDAVDEGDQREPVEIRLQFAGDVFLHWGPIEAARTGENTFDFRPFVTHIRPFIDGDLAIVNMEVPVDAFGQNEGLSSFPFFNSPFEILDAVQYAGFNHLISANNHSFDQGFQGLLNTVDRFERAGISHTGMHVDWDDFHTPTLIDVNGIQVGILAYTDSVNGLESLVPEASRAYAVRRFRSHVLDDVPDMIADMEALREAGAELVILALHWGEEYGNAPTEMQRVIAKALSEAGADVIMGKHPHTVHPVEWHEREDGTRTLIMYSLGNFIADQTRLTDASVQAQMSMGTDNSMGIPFAGRTQFGMLVSLQVIRESDGRMTLETADVVPTLAMRDFSGQVLRHVDDVTIMPLIGGELPMFITDELYRTWGRVAYNHVVDIVGEAFIRQPDE